MHRGRGSIPPHRWKTTYYRTREFPSRLFSQESPNLSRRRPGAPAPHPGAPPRRPTPAPPPDAPNGACGIGMDMAPGGVEEGPG
ncbi:MAG: hypothetical protein GY859_17900 [Desulfobacterales bacterium]|nr:hypothetical protein [Desulfobacterales bacterium]